MNQYIAVRPYIAMQIIEQLKKLPYTEVSGLIGELNEAMDYQVQLNWNRPVEDEEEKKEQKKPIGFRCLDDIEVGDGDDGEEEPDEPETIICKKTRKIKK